MGHSYWYDDDLLVEKTLPVKNTPTVIAKINPAGLKNYINNCDLGNYSQIIDFLRETNDAQFGIVSFLDTSDHNKPKWIRDATNSLGFKERLPNDSPIIEANNALLRCLSRLRAIDYAIENKEEWADWESAVIKRQLRTNLQNQFASLAEKILKISQDTKISNDEDKLKKIIEAEKEFNTDVLIKTLHDANLTKGCYTAEAAEKLLFHYRNLSSLLDPARTMVTLTYDKTAGVFQRQTQHPVTRKTQAQKDTLNELQDINPHPFIDIRNAHNSNSLAAQEADSIFSALILDGKRVLPAQARKTHLAGLKNGFIEQIELIQIAKPEDATTVRAKPASTLWLGRSGTPVYVGKGEKDERIQLHALENLQQIRNAAKALGAPCKKLHVTCLNTDSKQENQDIMLSNLYKVATVKKNRIAVSNIPVNHAGTYPVNPVKVSDSLQFVTRKNRVCTY